MVVNQFSYFDVIKDQNDHHMDEKTQKITNLLEELRELTSFYRDNFGQIIVYTGMKFNDNGNIIPITDDEFDDLICK